MHSLLTVVMKKLCFLVSISFKEDVFQIIWIKIKTSCPPVALHSSLPFFDVTTKKIFFFRLCFFLDSSYLGTSGDEGFVL